MTVKELKELLEDYPEDTPVYAYLGEIKGLSLKTVFDYNTDKQVVYLDCGR